MPESIRIYFKEITVHRHEHLKWRPNENSPLLISLFVCFLFSFLLFKKAGVFTFTSNQICYNLELFLCPVSFCCHLCSFCYFYLHSFIKHLLKAYPVSSKVLGEKKIKKHDSNEGIVMPCWRGQRHKKTDTTAQ